MLLLILTIFSTLRGNPIEETQTLDTINQDVCCSLNRSLNHCLDIFLLSHVDCNNISDEEAQYMILNKEIETKKIDDYQVILNINLDILEYFKITIRKDHLHKVIDQECVNLGISKNITLKDLLMKYSKKNVSNKNLLYLILSKYSSSLFFDSFPEIKGVFLLIYYLVLFGNDFNEKLRNTLLKLYYMIFKYTEITEGLTSDTLYNSKLMGTCFIKSLETLFYELILHVSKDSEMVFIIFKFFFPDKSTDSSILRKSFFFSLD